MTHSFSIRRALLQDVEAFVSLHLELERESGHLTQEQVLSDLRQATYQYCMEALFVLALVTEMRRGEIVGLKWSDVNLAEGVISVQRSLVELKGGIIESKPKSTLERG